MPLPANVKYVVVNILRVLFAGEFAGVVFFSGADVDLAPTSERGKVSLRACTTWLV